MRQISEMIKILSGFYAGIELWFLNHYFTNEEFETVLEAWKVGYLEGHNNKDEISSVFGSRPTDNRRHIQQVIETLSGSLVTLTIRSERARQIRSAFTLI